MIKIISNKYFLFTLFVLSNCMAFAHDCSSPGDCEETAGYNAALAITGGVIALGAGLISTWMPPEVPDVPEDDFENEFGEDFDDEFSDAFDDDEFDSDENENEDDSDEDEFDSDEDDEEDEDDDEFEDDDDEDGDDEFEDDDENDYIDSLEDIFSKLEAIDFLDPGQKLADNLNNIKTIIVDTGDAGAKVGKGGIMLKNFLGGGKIENAALKFKNFVTKNKVLTNLVSKFGNKFNSLIKNNTFKTVASKFNGFKEYVGSGFKNLGHVADGLTFLNNLNKKIGGSKVTGLDEKIGAVAEETARYVFKTIVTKNPIVAVGDAVLSLAGGPNLDYVVDKTLDNYKNGVTKITDWVYSDHKSTNAKFNSAYDLQKERIDKMHLSPSEKRKKLIKVFKILKKSYVS